MYLPNDLWLIVKSYMFHDIKTQGKHLKNDPYIKLYNITLKLMPPLIIPRSGPRIIYSSATNTQRVLIDNQRLSTKKIRFVKFVYLRPMKYDFNKQKYIHNFVIREYQMLTDNWSEHDYYEQYYTHAYSI
jgi:hypothetical protein